MATQASNPTTKIKPRVKRLPKSPTGGVQLLLIQNVDHLGKQGDLVSVKRGHAFNFLIPNGLATVASPHHQRMIEKHKAKLQDIENVRLKSLRQLAHDLAKQSVTIEANANDEGHLYGSVLAPDIVLALKGLQVHVEPEHIRLEGPLKELGLYTVRVQLHPTVETELKVWVVPSVADKS